MDAGLFALGDMEGRIGFAGYNTGRTKKEDTFNAPDSDRPGIPVAGFICTEREQREKGAENVICLLYEHVATGLRAPDGYYFEAEYFYF